LENLSAKQVHDLLVITEIYRQQLTMYQDKPHRMDDRIVSISQPHIRLIVRGKASAEVEFGAKIAVSRVNDCFRIETLNWSNFSEGTELITSIEQYRQRYGCYPMAVLVDKLFRSRANLAFCKEHRIRLSGPRLGRPGPSAQEDRKIVRMDSAARNTIESPFGIGKRRYELGRIMAKLRCTAESVIAMQFLLLNPDCKVRSLVRFIIRCLLRALEHLFQDLGVRKIVVIGCC
jgi:transposase, IS5 family